MRYQVDDIVKLNNLFDIYHPLLTDKQQAYFKYYFREDYSLSEIAEIMDVDYFVILTAVEKVSINFGKENQKDLDKMTVEEAEKYIEEGHFAAGSMLPKVKAAVKFAKSKKGRKSIIASLDKAGEALDSKTGTLVIYE